MAYATKTQLDAEVTARKNADTDLSTRIKSLEDWRASQTTGPTPVPPTTTPPPSGGSATGIAFEDFSTLADIGAFRAKYGLGTDPGFNADLFAFDTAVQYAGHKTLRYDLPSNSTRSPHWQVNIPVATRNLWAGWASRWSPGFHIACPNPAGSGYKDPAAAWANAESRSGVDFSNGDLYDLSIGIKVPGTNTYYNSPDPEGVNVQHVGRVGSEWTDGGWYEYRYNLRQVDSTHVGARFWKKAPGGTFLLQNQFGYLPANGELIYPITLAGVVMPYINRFLLGENFNQTRDTAMARWVGYLELIDGESNPNPYGL